MSNKVKTTFTALALAALAACALPGVQPPAGDAPAPTADAGGPIAAVGAPRLALYHAAPPTIDAAFLAREAERFDMADATFIKESDYVLAKLGTRLIRVDPRRGLIFYQDTAVMWGASSSSARPVADGEATPSPPPARPPVPDEPTAIELATAYALSHNLTQGEAPVFFQANATMESSSNQPEVSLVTQREIVFKRQIAGLPALGAGSQASVFIGGDGRINGALYDWPALVETRQVTSHDAATAMAGLQTRLDQMNAQVASHQRVTAFEPQTPTLSYLGVIGPDGGKALTPVYAVSGRATIDGRERENYMVYLPASADAPVPDLPASPGPRGAFPAPLPR